MVQFEYKIFSSMPTTTRGGKSIDWSAVEKSLNELVTEVWKVVSLSASDIGLIILGNGSVEPIGTVVLRRRAVGGKGDKSN